MEHEETGCQAPERPILCINNCGFFGSSATMNMCSKCHKDHILKQEQVKLAASSIDCAVNGSGSSSSSNNELAVGANLNTSVGAAEPPIPVVVPPTRDVLAFSDTCEGNTKEGPSRCNACKKRVGLTGFNCRCGNLFCAAHRYSDKHDCQFNYRMAARDAIAKGNPVVKAEKLDKI